MTRIFPEFSRFLPLSPFYSVTCKLSGGDRGIKRKGSRIHFSFLKPSNWVRLSILASWKQTVFFLEISHRSHSWRIIIIKAGLLQQILTSVEKESSSFRTHVLLTQYVAHPFTIIYYVISSPYIFSKGNIQGETTRLLLARSDTHCHRASPVLHTILRRKKKRVCGQIFLSLG